MATQKQLTGKYLQISKANSTTVAVVAVSAFIVVFSLVASNSLLKQRSYQARVIEKKKTALNQLVANNQAATELVATYQSFVNQSDNIIGGEAKGKNADRDGDNAKIILDALPSKYDFPALTSSLEKLLDDENFEINSISGTDNEVDQQGQASDVPIEIPFEIDVTGNYGSAQTLMKFFEKSIRPLKVNQLSLEGSDDQLTITISGVTYYQPAKTLEISKEIVK